MTTGGITPTGEEPDALAREGKRLKESLQRLVDRRVKETIAPLLDRIEELERRAGITQTDRVEELKDLP